MVLNQPAVLKAEAAEEQRLVIEALTKLARLCSSELGATSVLLFGSRARSDWHRGSDCDVLVVSEVFERMTLGERWRAVYGLWDGPVDLSPIAATPAEFEFGKQGSGIVAMALADGVIELLAVPSNSRT